MSESWSQQVMMEAAFAASLTTSVPNHAPQHAPADAREGQPGMDWQAGRCATCDSRYCGYTCHMVPGTIYVPGQGWVFPKEV